MEQKENKNTKPSSWIQAVRNGFIPERLQWVYENPKAFRLAFELASRAKREDGKEWYRGEQIDLKSREFIVGRLKTSAKIGLSPAEYRKFYKNLEKDNIIKTIKATNRYSVGKWLGDELFYINPVDEKPADQPAELPTDDPQATSRRATNKEVKNDKEISPTSPKGSQGIVSGKEKRKAVKFPKDWYDSIIEEYQSLKGITLQGSEFKPIQQTIKSMFMDGRTREQVIETMKWVAEQDYSDWTLWTVKKKLPEVLPRLGIQDSTPQSPQDQALVERALREKGGGGK